MLKGHVQSIIVLYTSSSAHSFIRVLVHISLFVLFCNASSVTFQQLRVLKNPWEEFSIRSKSSMFFFHIALMTEKNLDFVKIFNCSLRKVRNKNLAEVNLRCTLYFIPTTKMCFFCYKEPNKFRVNIFNSLKYFPIVFLRYCTHQCWISFINY